jgi:hypothetical protein
VIQASLFTYMLAGLYRRSLDLANDFMPILSKMLVCNVHIPIKSKRLLAKGLGATPALRVRGPASFVYLTPNVIDEPCTKGLTCCLLEGRYND